MNNTIANQKSYRDRFGVKPVLLPSGETFKLKRVSFSTLIASQQIPQALTELALETTGFAAERAADDERRVSKGIAERAAESMQLMKHVVAAACVEPQVVVERTDDADALTVDELTQEDQTFIFAYAVRGEAGATIPTSDGGEVEVDSLKNFRQSGRRANVSHAGKDGKNVGRAPVRARRSK